MTCRLQTVYTANQCLTIHNTTTVLGAQCSGIIDTQNKGHNTGLYTPQTSNSTTTTTTTTTFV